MNGMTGRKKTFFSIELTEGLALEAGSLTVSEAITKIKLGPSEMLVRC